MERRVHTGRCLHAGGRTRAIRSPSCSTARASAARRCSTSRTGRISRRRPSSCRRPRPRPTTGCASSRRRSRRPFAGHPTLGTCHAWLAHGGRRSSADVIVQECGVGLVPVRPIEAGLAFAAPPLLRSGPARGSTRRSGSPASSASTGARSWTRRGPTTGCRGSAILLADADAVLAVRPGFSELDIGIVGPHPHGGPADFEVRAFFPKEGAVVEDPVTGSLNASLAQWLLGTGRAARRTSRSQGTHPRPLRARAHLDRLRRGDLGRRRHDRLRHGDRRSLGGSQAGGSRSSSAVRLSASQSQ